MALALALPAAASGAAVQSGLLVYGDAGKVKNAKNTILYAVIGLVIAIFATAIVSFVAGNFT